MLPGADDIAACAHESSDALCGGHQACSERLREALVNTAMGRTLQANDGAEDVGCCLEDSPALTALTAPQSSPGNFQCNEVRREAGMRVLDDAVTPITTSILKQQSQLGVMSIGRVAVTL